eukprot:1816570-Amphidinium_carterae.1
MKRACEQRTHIMDKNRTWSLPNHSDPSTRARFDNCLYHIMNGIFNSVGLHMQRNASQQAAGRNPYGFTSRQAIFKALPAHCSSVHRNLRVTTRGVSQLNVQAGSLQEFSNDKSGDQIDWSQLLH